MSHTVQEGEFRFHSRAGRTVTRGQPSEASEKKSEPGHQQSHCGDATDGRTVSRALGFQFRFLICLQIYDLRFPKYASTIVLSSQPTNYFTNDRDIFNRVCGVPS